MIYYLAHPYSDNPLLAWHNAYEWTASLREQGLVVFSPILHTHHFHMEFKRETGTEDQYINELIKYVEWDLDILDHMDVTAVTILLSKTAYEKNSGDFSDVIGVGDPTIWPDPNTWCINWLSSGCKKEYDWAKKHSIRVLELEAFLQSTEIEL